jgi:uncharacterized protein (TIGR02646 family)
MIRINRCPCPCRLDTTQRALAAHDYRHHTVVKALKTMQHFKCCYCEIDISKVGSSALWVDHFIAKTNKCFNDVHGRTNWNLANAWNNLLMSCSTCNRNKGTDEPFDSITRERLLIDPSDSEIDPEDHIGFIIEDVVIVYKSRNGSILGENSIKNLKLTTRHDIYSLLRKRKLEIDNLFADLVSALTEHNMVVALSKINDLQKMTSAHQPHASFCREYINCILQKFNNENLKKINEYCGLNLEPIIINIATGTQVIV